MYDEEAYVEQTSKLRVLNIHSLAPLTKRKCKTHVKYHRDI